MPDTASPSDPDAEAQVLGSMLVSSDALDSALELLSSSDFYGPRNADLFRAMGRLRETGDPVNSASVSAEGWMAADLVALTLEAAPTAIVVCCQRVRGASLRRSILSACESVSAIARSSGPEDALEALLSQSEGLSVEAHGGASLSTGTQAILELLQSQEAIPALRTGFSDLDKVVVGFKPSTLTILGARPSIGKSALALHFALEASKTQRVLFFSLEMSLVELAQRIAAMWSSVPAERIRRRDLTLPDAQALEALAPRLGSLLVDDDPVLRMADIRSRARRVQRRGGLGLVVVDYLQLMTGRRQENRQVEVADLSRSFKLLSKELDVPVLALSQLSREMDRENRRPRLSDLRESGALEQDADVVLLLHRERDRRTSELSDDAWLMVSKHRNGPCGAVALRWEPEHSRFVSPSSQGF